MFGLVIATIAGAVVGATVKGVTAYKTTMKNADEYKEAAEDVRKATEQYSGKNAYNRMTQAGNDLAYQLGTAAGNEALGISNDIMQNPGSTGAGVNAAALQNAQNVGDTALNAANAGFQQGMNNEKSLMDAKYNAATQKAQQKMKQADINYNVANQAAQEGFSTAGNAAGLYNSLRKTKNGRTIAG